MQGGGKGDFQISEHSGMPIEKLWMVGCRRVNPKDNRATIASRPHKQSSNKCEADSSRRLPERTPPDLKVHNWILPPSERSEEFGG